MNHWNPLGSLVLCLFASVAVAGEPDPSTMTLDRALALAHERSPDLQIARYEQETARGAIRGAGAPPNPLIDAGLGTRSSTTGLEFEVGLSVPLRLAEARPARKGAMARAEAAGGWAAEAERRITADVSRAFLSVPCADKRVAVLVDAVGLAHGVVAAIESRVSVGDAAAIELTIAELALARAEAELAAQRAEREQALGALRLAIGLDMEEPLLPVGLVLERDRYAPYLESLTPLRPDVAALKEQVAGAEADLGLARARGLPDLGLWGRYAQEEGASVVAGGLSLEVPIFYRAEGERAVASARVRQAEAAVHAGARVAEVELSTAARVYSLRLEAVDQLETGALPRAARQSASALRAHELGQLPLAQLLLINGYAFEARLEHADAELAAALAGVDLLEAAGWTP